MDLLGARPIAEIDPDPFCIFNFPGPMELTALFRPHIEIVDGLVKSLAMPANTFYCHDPASLVLFVGADVLILYLWTKGKKLRLPTRRGSAI